MGLHTRTVDLLLEVVHCNGTSEVLYYTSESFDLVWRFFMNPELLEKTMVSAKGPDADWKNVSNVPNKVLTRHSLLITSSPWWGTPKCLAINWLLINQKTMLAIFRMVINKARIGLSIVFLGLETVSRIFLIVENGACRDRAARRWLV